MATYRQALCCWRSGISSWCSKDSKANDLVERSAHQRRMQAIAQQRKADTAQRQQDAAGGGSAGGGGTGPGGSSLPGAQGHAAPWHQGRGRGAADPPRDTTGKLHSLQAIGPEGDKRLTWRAQGLAYFGIGVLAGRAGD